MDNSKEFNRMVDEAIFAEPKGFANFDRTKNAQDQLQKMVGGLEKGFIDFPEWLEHTYGPHYRDKPNGHLHIFTSWEQLWLAFVMKEKYSKKWEGEKWMN